MIAVSIALIIKYKLGLTDVWIAMLAYPFAIIPFTYTTSFFFTKEATSQNFTLFWNLFFSGLVSIGVFFMRMVKEAEN